MREKGRKGGLVRLGDLNLDLVANETYLEKEKEMKCSKERCRWVEIEGEVEKVT